jgi:pimeloyl-ACP methyl ester carboxylesterase
MKEAYVARIPGARLEVVRDARHALPMEKPAEFNAVLARFLELHF